MELDFIQSTRENFKLRARMKSIFIPLMVLGLTLALNIRVQAYPELVRHGYSNCTTCHVSPSGGGLLTQYGRGLSNEVLSTWGSEKEALFLHGAVDTKSIDDWFLFGGDVRSVQVHKENKFVREGRYIPMEANFTLGLVRETWALVAQIGEIEDNQWSAEPITYYAMYKPREELSLRAGHFRPQYGVNIPEHITFIKSYLGFGLESSRDNFEVQWTDEKWTANGTLSQQSDEHGGEKSSQIQAQYLIGDSFKIASNYLSGKTQSSDRSLVGLWAILGFTKEIFWVSEVDEQNQKTNGFSLKSQVLYNKLGYTLFKGFDALMLHESLLADVSLPKNRINRTGIGFQFYPRPHFELSGAWTKQDGDYAWLLFHYYL